MHEIEHILLGVTTRDMLVFMPRDDYFPASDRLLDQLPDNPRTLGERMDECYLRVGHDTYTDDTWYVVVQWITLDDGSGAWYEKYHLDHIDPDTQLNNNWFHYWQRRNCVSPVQLHPPRRPHRFT